MTRRAAIKRIWFTAFGVGPDGAVKHFAVFRKGRAVYIRDFSGKEHRCSGPAASIAAVRRMIAELFRVRIEGVVLQQHMS